ncbi:MAG TPA: ketopantoate reductase family protein [Casimicrobiaceae bacterium]|nr:ketopantoate reductase family protein [Casimicrobiaceae bacterium]
MTKIKAAPFVPGHVAVLGAGAVGSFFGAMLASAGVAVTLVARPQHAEAIARDGLRVLQGGQEWQAKVNVATDVSAVSDADLVLVSVKSPDTTSAAQSLLPHLRDDARIASLQNGVDNAARIGGVLPHPVYAAVVYVGVQMDGPGRVRHLGRGDLVIGRPRALVGRGDADRDLRGIASMFVAAGIPCVHAPDIDAALWTKLAQNCALNAISALGRAPYGRMAQISPVRGIVEAAVREVVDVARADGVLLDADALIASTWSLTVAMPKQFSSTSQDVERGKVTEIDALNGFVAERGASLGVPTPVNATLHALVKLREPDVSLGA